MLSHISFTIGEWLTKTVEMLAGGTVSGKILYILFHPLRNKLKIYLSQMYPSNC